MKPLLLAAIYLVCAWLLELAVFPQNFPRCFRRFCRA